MNQPNSTLGTVTRDAHHVRHLANAAHDLRKVITVLDRQQERQHRAILVTAEDFDLFDVGIAIGDRCGNLGEYAGAVARFGLDLAKELALDVVLPGDGDPLLGLLAEVRQVAAAVAMDNDAATGRDPELALHIRMARRQGWTEDELTEALLHLSGYTGVPLIREAMLTASKVFKELREDGMD